MRLAEQGKPLLDKLEQLIHERIWSAGAESAELPV